MNNPQLTKRRWDPWPVSIIALFALAIPGFAGFIIFCNRHPADLVADNYYDQEIRYQGQMERMQRARQSPVRASVTYEASTRAILIKIPSPDVGPITGKIQLYRPSSVGLDRELKLELDAAGVQRVDARALAAGLWQVRLSWTAQQQDYYIDQKLVVGGGA